MIYLNRERAKEVQEMSTEAVGELVALLAQRRVKDGRTDVSTAYVRMFAPAHCQTAASTCPPALSVFHCVLGLLLRWLHNHSRGLTIWLCALFVDLFS